MRTQHAFRTENDDLQAVRTLHKFMKEFCIDCSVKDDLAFRCEECTFNCADGTCMVKKFKNKFAPDFKDFGAMGDL